MKAYSLDLRERIAAACAEPKARIYQVAAQFSVSISFVDKLLHRQRTRGSLAALPARGGPAPRLDPAGGVHLEACLVQQPDATLDELCTALVALGGPTLSRSAMGRAVIGRGWDRKKKAFTPPSATPSGS
jgi:transposase